MKKEEELKKVESEKRIDDAKKEEKNIKETDKIETEIKEENKEEIKDNSNKEKVSVEEKKEKSEKALKEEKDTVETKPIIKKKISKKSIILVMLLIMVVLAFSTIFAILNMNNSNIIEGTYIENVNISNFSKDEVKKDINDRLSKIEDIELNFGEYETIVKLEDIGLDISAKTAINDAINLGKTNNILIDNFSVLKTILFKTKLKLDIKIDEEKFNEAINNLQAEVPEAIKEYSYEIKGKELIITNGQKGEKIVAEELKNAIIRNIKEQFNGKVSKVQIPTKISEPQKINIEKIYNEVCKDAKDAYIVEEPFELYKEENGIKFAITIEEAKQILKENKETYIIPLNIIEPKVKIKDLGDKLFKQTLSKYTTIYDAGSKNRAHNIELAAKTINGTILLPGETFSYNGILGNTTKEKGYKIGTAYVGGKVVEAYGGGICQVSSTLYNSVLYANLEVVLRYNHSYVVSYVPAGRDATVSYGGKDFKFKNNRTYPIKIVANAKNGVVSVSIMGIKEEVEYEVELTSTVLSTTPRSVVYQDNSTLEEGKQKVIQQGYDGKKSIAYKIIKYNGQVISKTVLSKDTYKPMAKIVEVGTKKVNIPTSTTPVIQNTVIPETSI